MPTPIIMKFGGTSLGSAARIREAAELVHARRAQHPIVVTSAMSQVTNLLIETAHAALARKQKTVSKNLETIRQKHFAVAQTEQTRTEIETLLQKLDHLYEGIGMIRELSPRSLDFACSFGERLSSWLMVEALEALELKAERFDSRKLIRTDDHFGSAEVEWGPTKKMIRGKIVPRLIAGVVPVVTGYIGATKDDQTTTLGRGGSDYSAAIVGVSLNASEIQIWTDVDGMMTADPRMIPTAKILPTLSFQEAAELAYFGAKVLHPKTIQPAVDANIPVKILNTMNSKSKGTTIVQNTLVSKNSIKAISCKKNTSVVNICSSRMLGPYGFLARIFTLFDQYQVPVDVLATTEVSVSVTVEDGTMDKILLKELEKISAVKVVPHQTIISVVGNGLKNDYRVEQMVFNTLAKEKISTELISKGASQINLTFIVREKDTLQAMTALHDVLF